MIHSDLLESFFHQLLRRLIKDDKFQGFMDTEQLLQSLFVLFHIEHLAKSKFAGQFTRVLVESHGSIEDLLAQQPELMEEFKSDTLSKETSSASANPFSLIGNNYDLNLIFV